MEREKEGAAELAKSRLELFTLIYDILTNWWVVLLGAVAGALLTYVVVSVQYVPEYTTSTTFAVSMKNSAVSYSDISAANSMAESFQKILKSSLMKNVLRDKMDLEELDAKIRANVLEGTNLLTLSVTADNPKNAIDIIRAIMDNYTEVSYYMVGDAVLSVLEEPMIPYSPSNSMYVSDYMKKGFVGGAVIIILLLGLLSYFHDSIKQEKDIEEKLDARSLGWISFERKYKTVRDILDHKKKALLVTDPVAGFRFVEEYKRLAAKVDYQMSKRDRKVLVVTSVSENEGKSTIAANLAISLAEQSKKVLLMEGDLRRPSQFLIFGVDPEERQEIGEFLKGYVGAGNLLTKSDVPGLFLLVGKNCYSTSTEIIRSERFVKLLEAYKKAVDYIIIDSPPAGLMADAEILGEYADAVMMVVRQNYVLAENINDIMDNFRANGTKVLGVVLNGVHSFDTTAVGNYGRYGRYGRYGKYVDRQKEE